jgi:hypothetical protein
MAVTLKFLRTLAKHTLCKIVWFDIQEDSAGDPNSAHLIARTTYSMYWGTKMQPGTKIRNLIFTTTIDPDNESQQGWLCIPASLVASLEVIVPAEKMKNEKEDSCPVENVESLVRPVESAEG